MIRHIVLFSMKKPADLDGMVHALLNLRSIPEVVALSCSRNLASSEFDAALTVDVRDAEALQAYREHPQHAPVLERMRDSCRRIDVADIEV